MLLLKLLQNLIKALNSEGTPGQVAAGIALGAVFGLTPLINLHNLLFLAAAMVLNVSFPGVMLGWALFLPVGFALDPVFHAVGLALLTAPPLQALWTLWFNTPFVPLTNFNNTIVLGSLVVWFLAVVPVFFLARWLVAQYRERVFERLRKTPAFRAVKASKLWNVYQMLKP